MNSIIAVRREAARFDCMLTEDAFAYLEFLCTGSEIYRLANHALTIWFDRVDDFPKLFNAFSNNCFVRWCPSEAILIAQQKMGGDFVLPLLCSDWPTANIGGFIRSIIQKRVSWCGGMGFNLDASYQELCMADERKIRVEVGLKEHLESITISGAQTGSSEPSYR